VVLLHLLCLYMSKRRLAFVSSTVIASISSVQSRPLEKDPTWRVDSVIVESSFAYANIVQSLNSTPTDQELGRKTLYIDFLRCHLLELP
jgi:hypothetical protein